MFASSFIVALFCIPLAFAFFWTLWFIVTDYNPIFRPLSWLYILVTFIFSSLFFSVTSLYQLYALYWFPIKNYNGTNYFSENFNSIILMLIILSAIGAFIYFNLGLAIAFIIILTIGLVSTKYSMGFT